MTHPLLAPCLDPGPQPSPYGAFIREETPVAKAEECAWSTADYSVQICIKDVLYLCCLMYACPRVQHVAAQNHVQIGAQTISCLHVHMYDHMCAAEVTKLVCMCRRDCFYPFHVKTKVFVCVETCK